MASTSSFYLFLNAFLLFNSITLFPRSYSAQALMCHDNERVALLQIKQSFLINNSASFDPTAYPKMASWGNYNESANCCLWNGVECDEVSGYVIGLDLSSSYLYGSINSNSSLFNLIYLQYLNLGDNNFNFSQIPSGLGCLTRLMYLNLARCAFSGEIPTGIKNLTHLNYLSLGENNLIGEIPLWISNLTQLSTLKLNSNQFHGKIPVAITKLSKLKELYLGFNHFTGTLKFEIFSSLNNLVALYLSQNNLSVVTSININASLPKFHYLGLGYCNLRKFPEFLRLQDRLMFLRMEGNKIQGQIPRWIGNMSTKSLSVLYLSDNLLTGFEQPHVFSNLTNLLVLYLSFNRLDGPLPIPSSSVLLYSMSHNSLSGEIPPSLCNLHSLQFLDLAYNNLSGNMPQCLGNFSVSLDTLSLTSNSLHGSIPTTFANESKLKVIDLSQNQLEGRMPRSLANCEMLEKIDISENNMTGEFPYWLGTLPKLEILILRSNQFSGRLGTPATMYHFPKLRILDLSSNHFTGILPFEFFQNLICMISNTNQFTYMMTNQSMEVPGTVFRSSYEYQMTLTNKGMSLKYAKISNIIAAIDLSNNKFQGEIPQSLAMLSMVNVLDLSNNSFSGHIPSTLANMTKLESLDLSFNNFSGEIPPQLTQLTFLGFFNVSSNQLVGSIPHGNQFHTFENSSYEGNLGLCGVPLTKKCQSSSPSDPTNPTFKRAEEDSNSLLDFGWEVVVIGYGIGLILGVVFGYWFAIKKHDWLLKTFRIEQPKRGKEGRNRVAVAGCS